MPKLAAALAVLALLASPVAWAAVAPAGKTAVEAKAAPAGKAGTPAPRGTVVARVRCC